MKDEVTDNVSDAEGWGPWGIQYEVAEFMAKHGVTMGQPVDFQVANLAQGLIREESLELLAALDIVNSRSFIDAAHADLAPLAKEMADVIYVVLYAANVYGIDMSPVFDAVQRSNMTKAVDGPKRADGKVQKGPSYIDPMQEIREILEGEHAKD